MAQTFASVVVQTYLTFTARRWAQTPTISFTNGATAGSEVVTVDSSLNINVQIQSGVSTMLQIKTAIDATAGSLNGLSAGDLVSTAITAGHNSDAVVTVKSAFLTGGVAVASARLAIGHLIFTAVTAGTAGNNVRIKYTSGGSLSVSVSTNDITIQLKNDGSSTNALIKAAVDGTPAAAALVTVASDGLAMSFVPTTAMALAFTNLAGGVAAAAAVVVLQDLTFTAPATGVAGNAVSITYTTGATAGSEVVTVNGSAVTVQISNGVSTATQIRTAFIAVPAAVALATCTISGTGSNAQKTVNASAMSGAVGDDDLGYYRDEGVTALTGSFVLFDFGFSSKTIIFRNEETSGSKNIVFSWAGVTTDGVVAPGQVVTFDVPSGNCVWMKYSGAAPAYKLIVKG